VAMGGGGKAAGGGSGGGDGGGKAAASGGAGDSAAAAKVPKVKPTHKRILLCPTQCPPGAAELPPTVAGLLQDATLQPPITVVPRHPMRIGFGAFGPRTCPCRRPLRPSATLRGSTSATRSGRTGTSSAPSSRRLPRGSAPSWPRAPRSVAWRSFEFFFFWSMFMDHSKSFYPFFPQKTNSARCQWRLSRATTTPWPM
jgi:hypothetical protein